MSSPTSPVPDPTAAVPDPTAAAIDVVPTAPTLQPPAPLLAAPPLDVLHAPPAAPQKLAAPVPPPSYRAARAAVEQPAPKSKSSKKKKATAASVTVTMATAANTQTTAQGAQGENTGRWTAEEHRLFLQGLERHGKGWKKIASLIKSRTVVQIRTHAQKYFQKLAKARQNGEEGEISMEGRGGISVVTSMSTSAAQTSKRRRQTSGTKRKAIQSVVSSAQRQGKKLAAAQANAGVPNPVPPLPAVAPALAPYVLPVKPYSEVHGAQTAIPSISTAQGTISGPALEESLFRFFTPVPISPTEPQLNDVARQAGAHPIQLPLDQSGIRAGELSPTGVSEFSLHPSWTDAKDTPSWYAKGSDVDALLDVSGSLEWLEDTGDLNETYQPALDVSADVGCPDPALEKAAHAMVTSSSVNNMSMVTLPRIESSGEVVVPPLPSLFDGGTIDEPATKKVETAELSVSPSAATIDEELQVFDTPMEEHDFVSSMLEQPTGESLAALPVLP